jgi:hypothetical protein
MPLLVLGIALATLVACGGEATPPAASPTSLSGLLSATELAVVLPTVRPTGSPGAAPGAQGTVAALDRPAGTRGGLLQPRVVLFHDDFDSVDSALFVGRTEYGSQTSVSDGAFWLEVKDQGWQNVTLNELTDLGNGVVLTDVSVAGDGAAGVVARANTDSAGEFWFYVCWVNTRGEAGCHTSVQSHWTELWYAAPGDIPIAAANHLALAMIGSELTFEINGRIAATFTDATTTSGMWGVFAESYSGSVTAAFESLTIGEMGQ